MVRHRRSALASGTRSTEPLARVGRDTLSFYPLEMEAACGLGASLSFVFLSLALERDRVFCLTFISLIQTALAPPGYPASFDRCVLLKKEISLHPVTVESPSPTLVVILIFLLLIFVSCATRVARHGRERSSRRSRPTYRIGGEAASAAVTDGKPAKPDAAPSSSAKASSSSSSPAAAATAAAAIPTAPAVVSQVHSDLGCSKLSSVGPLACSSRVSS